ncbi:ATP-binding protein [Roseomonas marmotae]|uniref:ATP-binding protein n=1 Tax=Roseomonas marmotae TaxID=2768161 RepID=A0ABS3KFB6_9PROT|nr:ATP-binding protein [Roseomonas marmotae]MBO1076168.1 ATP-binding protein [Roseomonas marmotae]QTI81795.1 ATP-binding protein [Roseomonas marmotae]
MATAPLADLLDHLALLRLRLARQVALLRATGRFNEDPFRGLYIGEAEADAASEDVPPQGSWADRAAILAERIATRDLLLRQRAGAEPGLPIPCLTRHFGLGRPGAECLVAAAGALLDPRLPVLLAYAQNDAAARQPTLGLMLELLAPEPAARVALFRLLQPDGVLLSQRLLAPPPAEFMASPRPTMPLLPDAALMGLLLGEADTALGGALAPLPAVPPGSDGGLAAMLARQCDPLRGQASLVLLTGPGGDLGQAALAAAEAARQGAGLLALDPSHPAGAGLEDAAFAALCGRALRLVDAALLLPAADLPPARLHALLRATARPGRPVFCAGPVPDACLPAGLEVVEIDMPAADEARRAGWWQAALVPEGAAELGVALARQTRLGPLGIAAAVARARRLAPPGEWPPATPEPLAQAARSGAGAALARLAQPVLGQQPWEDLVLPPEPMEELELLLAAASQGARLADWGFGRRQAALVALFAGPSGTGKTMAAGLVARRAGLPLHRIDLSAVVSKYIGETEKQLDQVLREAEAIGAALLFDEADALFGKRTEVRDAHDRYANQEVAFLLQRIECFDGLVILTTNLGGHVDPAFLRRIGHVVRFPMPDEAMRLELWRRAFPPAAPLAPGLDLAVLARGFDLAGGNIRNAALGAAQRAAVEGRAIGMADALRAVTREMRKLGRVPSRVGLAGQAA